MQFKKLFKILLWLVALHSLCVGIALIFIPPHLLQDFGYINYQGRFFIVQGGVFHIVMAGAYSLAAIDLSSSRNLLLLILFAKGMATLFLLGYYILLEPIMMVLVSGTGDGLMFIAIFLLNKKLKELKEV